MKQSWMKRPRKLAAHLVIMPDGACHPMSVVEIADGTVLSVRPLRGEDPFTEWMGGKLRVSDYLAPPVNTAFDQRQSDKDK